MSAGAIVTSPAMEDTPSLTASLNPDDTATATIITRKLTAMQAIAILPLNFNFPAMKRAAFMIYEKFFYENPVTR